jgi:hypothetical protein
MDINVDWIAGDGSARRRNLHRAARGRGTPGKRRKRRPRRRGADREIRNASRTVAVPGACADRAGRRNVRQLQVRAGIRVLAHAGGAAVTVVGLRRPEISSLSPRQREARYLRPHGDVHHLAGRNAVRMTVLDAVIVGIMATACDRETNRKRTRKQTYKSKEPPHETSPPEQSSRPNGPNTRKIPGASQNNKVKAPSTAQNMP